MPISGCYMCAKHHVGFYQVEVDLIYLSLTFSDRLRITFIWEETYLG